MNDVILIIISYCLVLLIGFGIIVFLQAGFFIPFLKVKTSRGKKILVKIRKSTTCDYVAAEEIEGQLVFKYFKEQFRVSKYKDGIYRSFNVNCVDVDAETWGVVKTDFNGIGSSDPSKNDSLIERALLKPDKRSKKTIL